MALSPEKLSHVVRPPSLCMSSLHGWTAQAQASVSHTGRAFAKEGRGHAQLGTKSFKTALEAGGKRLDVAPCDGRQISVGHGGVGAGDDLDQGLKLVRDRDGEAHLARDVGHERFVVVKSVGVEQREGDGAEAVGVEAVELLADGGGVRSPQDAHDLAGGADDEVGVAVDVDLCLIGVFGGAFEGDALVQLNNTLVEVGQLLNGEVEDVWAGCDKQWAS